MGLGTVLTQEESDEEHVAAFASCLLNNVEKDYSMSERECLSVVLAVEKWRPFQEGAQLEVVTDHVALSWVFNTQSQFTVQYRKCSLNTIPDALSRIELRGRSHNKVVHPCCVSK